MNHDVLPEGFEPFNPVEFLQSQEEIELFMREAFNDEDPQVFVIALAQVVRHHGVADVAEAAGLNRESLYKVLFGKSRPTWDTVHRLLRALNIHLAA